MSGNITEFSPEELREKLLLKVLNGFCYNCGKATTCNGLAEDYRYCKMNDIDGKEDIDNCPLRNHILEAFEI